MVPSLRIFGELYHVKKYLLEQSEEYEKTYSISQLLIVEFLKIKLAYGKLYHQKNVKNTKY